MTRFSVVTITYNAQAVLQPTLQSVLKQTYEGVEHLIIDGASKDDTLRLAEAYKQQSDELGLGHKVIIQSEPDHGIYDAMNKGLTQASGDYIIYMNAGDSFPADDTLEQIARRCHLNELPSGELPAVLYGETDIIDQERRFLRHRRLPRDCRGARFARACSCAIRLSTPVPTSPRTCSTTRAIAIRPT